MTDIVRQLQAARQNLLDLTMRNRLLNFRPTKLKTIQLIDAMPAEIYNSLVLREKAMEFLPRPVMLEDEDTDDEDTKAQDLFAGLEENSAHSDQANASAPQQLPSPEAVGAESHEDRFLQTALASDELQKRLFCVYQQARSVFEEQGQTILYLAIGFLEWTESPSALQAKRAPLILIPTELERPKVSASFKLRWTGGDLFPNISLQAKLTEQRITLPEFEMPDEKTGIDQYLHSVATIIA